MTTHRAPGLPSLIGRSTPRHVTGLPPTKPTMRPEYAPHINGIDETCPWCQMDKERAQVIRERGIEWSSK